MTMCMKVARNISARPVRASVKCQASMHANVAKAAGVGLASLGLALSANAATVKMGTDTGALLFEPASTVIKSGESVTFVNNAGFPHNIIFDEDAVPTGADADALSKDDLINGANEAVVVGPFEVKGEYKYYCNPHQGAGMKGSITVE